MEHPPKHRRRRMMNRATILQKRSNWFTLDKPQPVAVRVDSDEQPR